jgi:aldose 1-epimerase
VDSYSLGGLEGLRLRFIRLGAAITELLVPDRAGHRRNVVLAHGDLSAYADQTQCLGAVCGRYANRIDGGRFRLDGREVRLAVTDRGSNVHGGPRGFDRSVWTLAGITEGKGIAAATLTLRSPDGDQGFPGTLDATVTYRLGPDWLEIDYSAVTDRPTIVSLTNHSYFNLGGEGSGSVEDHWMQVHSALYTPSDARLVPSGLIERVEETPFDFTAAKPIGRDLRRAHPMILAGRGYDVNFMLNGRMQEACRVWDPTSGRLMRLSTSAPAVQFYSGNGLDGSTVSRDGLSHRQGDGFCLEPHHPPNSPNIAGFTSPVLRPGETWRSLSRFDFGIAAADGAARG